jgi:hypothetical protein
MSLEAPILILGSKLPVKSPLILRQTGASAKMLHNSNNPQIDVDLVSVGAKVEC